MEIDFERNEARVSVRELAAFERRTGEHLGQSSRQWRAKVGQDWHKLAEKETRERHPNAEFEKSIKSKWLHRNWTFTIQGRIDQIIPTDDSIKIVEVKTVRANLPLASETLKERYPEYLAQAYIYLRLSQKLPEFSDHPLKAELALFDIDQGIVQRTPVRENDYDHLSEQLERLVRYLEDRRTSKEQLRELTLKGPFETLRAGQAQAIEQLDQSISSKRITLFNAPTGFGKTGIILQQVLNQMQSGRFDRCIYLTSRSTGQTEVARQLSAMTEDRLRWIQMRNRAEHRIETIEHTCTGDSRCDKDHSEKWAQSEILPRNLFRNGSFETQHAREIGEKTGLCPYALTRACLPYADFWLGDFNYIFSPNSRSVFINALGFDASRTILVVDEAHNLSERVAAAYDVELDSSTLLFAADALREIKAPSRVTRSIESLADKLDQLPDRQEIEMPDFYELLELCEEISRLWENARIDYELVPPFALETVSKIQALFHSFEDEKMEWFHWSPKSGSIKANCLTPEHAIRESISSFGRVILQSATLDPISSFYRTCGLDSKECSLVRGTAPWRDDAYSVAIDTRVDTRLKTRQRHYETTARTISEAVWASPQKPVAVFFPSYSYAESVSEYVKVVAPSIRLEVQTRGGDLKSQEDFVHNALQKSDLIVFIIGSHFSEGIDQLGGEVDLAIIVGPALSEMNLVQKRRIANAQNGRSAVDAFTEVCAIPALRRVHQALGRMIRSPGQSARILLHCERFTEPTYNDLLLPEYQTETLLKSQADFENWLYMTHQNEPNAQR